MGRIDKKMPSTHPAGLPSAARRMARAKAKALGRARRVGPEPSDPGEAAPTSPASTAIAACPPTPWSPTLYEVERAAYRRRKPDLLRDAPGRFVVFVGEAMIGPFDDFPSAVEAGRRTFGFRPIYTKQILAEEPTAEAGTVEICRS